MCIEWKHLFGSIMDYVLFDYAFFLGIPIISMFTNASYASMTNYWFDLTSAAKSFGGQGKGV